MDSFSLFHLRFIEPEPNSSPNEWSIGVSSKAKSAWEGLAFERVCLMHIREIQRALQIGGVKTSVCSWRHTADETYGKGAQIDLLILPFGLQTTVYVRSFGFKTQDYAEIFGF